MASDYYLLFKTAQAEFRAWNNLKPSAKSSVFPIVELTRGRKIPRADKNFFGEGEHLPEENWVNHTGIYDFFRNVENSREAFIDCEKVIIDLTREDSLSCKEIEDLAISDDGYQKWIDFLNAEKVNYQSLIPTLLVNPSENENEEEYKQNLELQFSAISDEFSGVAYRASVLIDTDFIYDLMLLANRINDALERGKQFWVILDHEFIRPGMGLLHASTTSGLIETITELIPNAQIVILSTSFPKSIIDLGNPDSDSFPMEEIFLFEEIKKNIGERNSIHYGDYGSINPMRNDIVGFSGWRPRIDFPSSVKKRTFYYREKRDVIGEIVEDGNKKKIYGPYGSHYVSVANKIVNDDAFEDMPDSWGVAQIKLAKDGTPPGKSPSFWISVRMEIHIMQQLKRMMLS